MAYLEEFRTQLHSRNYTKLLPLWQEYCAGDQADADEICEILKLIKNSECAHQFGQYVEGIIPLVRLIQNENEQQEAFRLIFDLETRNSPELHELALSFLKKWFGEGDAPSFNDKLRLVGLRGGPSFQGALSNFILLNHFQKGNFVLHTAGWGAGEIIDVSFLREQVSIEFENLRGGKKDISFTNAFKTLIPLAKTHFLARRFDNPDLLEKDLRENSVETLRAALQDLGPKTAQEIKDEIAGLLINEEDYSKWWQQVRAKLKKDPLIETPDSAKEPFRIRKGHASWEEKLTKAFQAKSSFDSILTAAHNLVRDCPELLKIEGAKARIIEKVQGLLLRDHISEAEHLQVLLFLEDPLAVKLEESSLKKFVLKIRKVEDVLSNIGIIALKKRLLTAIREYRSDWLELFLGLLLTIDPNQLRDIILKELATPAYEAQLTARIKQLLDHPKQYPEAFWWYFQKVVSADAPYFNTRKDKYHFFEALLILFNNLDHKPEYRDLAKKIYNLLTGNRFQVIRDILKDSSQEFASEFLLLGSKCASFTDHDKKILRSLAEVVHTNLAKEGTQDTLDLHTIWTTQEGFNTIQERIKHIGTVEIVDVAKEIEAARALGDLRENSEYKFALERRSRLQSEIKMLSDQFHKARIITKDDISNKAVGIGTKIALMGPKGEKITYTILGPWDADPERCVLSFQSKFAQSMWGKKESEKFAFKGEEFKILSIRSYLED